MTDIQIAGLEITVHGWQFPDATDYWDGNWLNVSATCRLNDSRASANGSILSTPELASWLSDLETMSRTLSGKADLKTMEPELSAEMEINTLGQITFSVHLTPDHLTQNHCFDFTIDQSHLQTLIIQLKIVLGKFPVKSKK